MRQRLRVGGFPHEPAAFGRFFFAADLCLFREAGQQKSSVKQPENYVVNYGL
jgi:hypothetical protein